jgi:hypothetical protein
MLSIGNWRKIRKWGKKQSQRKAPQLGSSFFPTTPPYNWGAPQVESQIWDESPHNESLETQPKPPLSTQITLASLLGHGQSIPGLRRKLQQ